MPGPLARRLPCALRWSGATGSGARRRSARCASASTAQPEEPLLVPPSIIDPDGRVWRPEQPVTPAAVSPEEHRQLWKAAIKLPMYSVAIVPVVVRRRGRPPCQPAAVTAHQEPPTKSRPLARRRAAPLAALSARCATYAYRSVQPPRTRTRAPGNRRAPRCWRWERWP